jgi:hypothetical protein
MIMYCLNRFCCYENFGTKSLKIELRLKRYEVFKFYGLRCKIARATFEFISKLGARLGFAKSLGALV